MEKLSIKAVAEIAGLTEHVIRAWEKRYGALEPKRAPSGRRVYSLSDVEKLKLLAILTSRGHSIKDIANLTSSELRRLMERAAEHSLGRQTKFLPDFSASSYVSQLTEICENFNLSLLISATKRAQHQFDTRTYLLKVVSPLLQIIGEQVSNGKMDVYQEHALTAVLRYQLSGILFSLEGQMNHDSSRGVITLASPEGDHHDMGVLMAAVLALLNGFQVLYLGANTPASSVAKAAEASQSPMVVIGSVAPESEVSPKKLREFFNLLHKELPEETVIWVGGWRSEEIKSSKASSLKFTFFESLQDFDRSLQRWQS